MNQPAARSRLLLFNLFACLYEQKELFYVGLGEYFLLLDALERGEGIGATNLQSLCETIWLDNVGLREEFRLHFERALNETWREIEADFEEKKRLAELEKQEALRLAKANKKGTDSIKNDPKPLKKPEETAKTDETSLPQPGPAAIQKPAEMAGFSLSVGADASRQLQNLAAEKTDRPANLSHKFVFSDDWLPLRRRELEHAWQRLVYRAGRGELDEMDVAETVRQTARTGLFTTPVFQKKPVNQANLLLLIDVGGSMQPFARLGELLVETAREQLGPEAVTVRFFHNLPDEFLFETPALLDGISIETDFRKLSARHTRTLIFSDAGAARGQFNARRVVQTRLFLAELARSTASKVWLNPMPAARWVGTSAGRLASQIGMHEANRRGLENAIKRLKSGQSTA